MAIKAEGRDALRSDPNRESSIVYSGANYERAYDWNANDGGPPLPGHVYSLLRMPFLQRGNRERVWCEGSTELQGMRAFHAEPDVLAARKAINEAFTLTRVALCLCCYLS